MNRLITSQQSCGTLREYGDALSDDVRSGELEERLAALTAHNANALVDTYQHSRQPSSTGNHRNQRHEARAEQRLDGKFLLRTSDPTLTADDVALGYKQLLKSNAAGGT